jgi:hypothetical protein
VISCEVGDFILQYFKAKGLISEPLNVITKGRTVTSAASYSQTLRVFGPLMQICVFIL